MVFGFPAVQGLELFLGENVLHVGIVEWTSSATCLTRLEAACFP
jgi:hypothetical protein